MVKGTARSIIIVKSPDRELFEEAIFIVRDGAGVSSEEVLTQAQLAAEEYLRAERGEKPLHPLVFTLLGAAGMGLAWLLSAILN